MLPIIGDLIRFKGMYDYEFIYGINDDGHLLTDMFALWGPIELDDLNVENLLVTSTIFREDEDVIQKIYSGVVRPWDIDW